MWSEQNLIRTFLVQGNGIGSVRMTAIRPTELLQRNSRGTRARNSARRLMRAQKIGLAFAKTRVPAPDFVSGPS